MAGKLTEETRQEIVRRYESGESAYRIAKDLPVSKDTILKYIRSCAIEVRIRRGLSEEQKQEIIRRYESGEGCTVLSREFGVWDSIIVRLIHRRSKIRSRADVQLVKHGHENYRPSDAALKEAYWGRSSGYPSAPQLAARWNVNRSTVLKWLQKANIPIRSKGQQKKIDVAMGRCSLPSRRGHGNRFTSEQIKAILSRRTKEESHEYSKRSWKGRRTSAYYPCHWCGFPVKRQLSQRKQHPISCHTEICRVAWANWARWGKRNQPRPLILQRLREILQEPYFRTLPRMLETLEKAGEPIGAGFEEYWEIMQDWPES